MSKNIMTHNTNAKVLRQNCATHSTWLALHIIFITPYIVGVSMYYIFSSILLVVLSFLVFICLCMFVYEVIGCYL